MSYLKPKDQRRDASTQRDIQRARPSERLCSWCDHPVAAHSGPDLFCRLCSCQEFA